MNEADLKTALSFLDYTSKETIVLQCYTAKSIPFVKRLMKKVMGEPSSMIEYNVWRYGPKTFVIVPFYKDIHGFTGKVFYLSYEDEHDWVALCSDQVSPNDIVPYTLTSMFDTIDVYNLLIRDDMTSQDAVNLIHNNHCVTIGS